MESSPFQKIWDNVGYYRKESLVSPTGVQTNFAKNRDSPSYGAQVFRQVPIPEPLLSLRVM